MTDVDPARVTDRTQFADALTRAREHAGLSVRDVARAADVPVATVGDYFSGRSVPPARAAEVLPRILRACGVLDVAAVAQWRAALARVRRADVPSPYRGGLPFEAADAGWFFGREALVRQLLERVGERHPLVVTGAPGAGVSSVLRAGLAPALGAAAVLTPGTSPCRRLADLLCAVTGHAADRVDRVLHSGPGGLPDLVGDRLRAVVVDQFEQLSIVDGASSRLFRAALNTLGRAGIPVVVGGRIPLRAGAVVVGRMTDDELRSTVEAPARRAHLTLPSAVADAALADVAHLAEPLPVLSRVMLETWRLREGAALTMRAYLAAVANFR